ncbi:MAG TPA: type II toxin-antitoxin system RelE/ParE family toxin [Thermoanaerobaculia bacterium]|nr:type II toxin-antitoxin system RelE/ParE family toxin [Thermoanaerobaculia bacterium]
MAYRLTLSARAVREIGEAYEWYEEQVPGLGHDLIEMLEALFELIAGSPGLYAETQRGVRRALLSRFPYGVFYATKGDIVSVLGVVHTSRDPRRWPRRLS